MLRWWSLNQVFNRWKNETTAPLSKSADRTRGAYQKDASWALPKFQLQTGQVKEPLLSLKMQTGWKEPTNKDAYRCLSFSCKQENWNVHSLPLYQRRHWPCFLPQLFCAAANTMSSFSSFVMSPLLTKLFVTRSMQFTYSPWFLQPLLQGHSVRQLFSMT